MSPPAPEAGLSQVLALRIAASVTVVVASMLILGMAFGNLGYAAAGAGSLLWLAWRHDNDVGVCLPLAILFLIVLGVMLLLFYLLLIMHPH